MKLPLALVCALLSLTLHAQEIRDVEYATGLRLAAHVPEGEGPFPIAVIIRGGNDAPLLTALSGTSFTSFAIDVRPPKMGFAASTADVHEAIRWIRRNAATYKGDPRRIALIGESSGGIVALVAAGRAAAETKVNAVVAYYTPADLAYIAREGSVPPFVRESWGVGEHENLSAWQREWSPVTYAGRMPPALLIHGSADTRLPRAFAKAGVPHEVIPPDADHEKKVIAWLARHLATP